MLPQFHDIDVIDHGIFSNRRKSASNGVDVSIHPSISLSPSSSELNRALHSVVVLTMSRHLQTANGEVSFSTTFFLFALTLSSLSTVNAEWLRGWVSDRQKSLGLKQVMPSGLQTAERSRAGAAEYVFSESLLYVVGCRWLLSGLLRPSTAYRNT